MNESLLLLFDGHALVHRAFHALPPLTASKTGEPTGAVYGFVRMVFKLFQDVHPSHWAIAFDRPTPTFRHVRYDAYKAQRPKAPDELVIQFGRVRQVVDALSIPVFEVDGYEADDVLGTLVRQANDEGMDVLIVTGDADTMQLVCPKTRVLVPERTFGDVTVFDETAVQQKYSVTPAQIPDLKALKGDPSDNIPGVRGIGDKIARRLIQQFGSLEGIYEHIEDVTPPKVKHILQAEREQAELSRDLATIRLDAPVTLKIVGCEVGGHKRDELVDLFRELEFSTLLDKLPEIGQKQSGRSDDSVSTVMWECGCYELVDSAPAVQKLVAKLHSVPCFAMSLAMGRKGSGVLAGIALSTAQDEAYYLPVGHKGWEQQLELQRTLDLLKPVFENAGIAKVVHDGKGAMSALAGFGIELRNVNFDTMIAAHLLGEKSLELRVLAFNKLGLEVPPSAVVVDSKHATIADMSITAAAEYLRTAVDVIRRVHQPLETELRRQGLWQLFTDVEMLLVPVLADMERSGVALSVEPLRHMSQTIADQLQVLERAVYDNVGHQFNINSPQQLGDVLFKELGLPGAKRTKTGYSTDASILDSLKGIHPVVGLVLEYRQLIKLKSTYIDALPGLVNPNTGRIHTTFNQTATATGRLSSSDPNLQNIPIRGDLGRKVRLAFVAQSPCVLVGADYSQIELRVLAHFSRDPRLVDAFRKDEDIHNATASEVFGVALNEVTSDMRRVAKVVNFGVVYGMSDYGLGQAADLSRVDAAKFIESYFGKYAAVKEYLDSTRERARELGYVQTFLGRRRYIPEIRSSNRQVKESAERMAINMPIQGTAADIIKIAMIRLHKEIQRRGLNTKMILQVHDELLFETPPDEVNEVKLMVDETMSHAVELSVPLKVDIKVGYNWGEME